MLIERFLSLFAFFSFRHLHDQQDEFYSYFSSLHFINIWSSLNRCSTCKWKYVCSSNNNNRLAVREEEDIPLRRRLFMIANFNTGRIRVLYRRLICHALLEYFDSFKLTRERLPKEECFLYLCQPHVVCGRSRSTANFPKHQSNRGLISCIL